MRQINWIPLLFTAATFAVSACSRLDLDSSAPKNIFGDDDRVEADTNLFPYKAIGRVEPGCTGFLIGSKLVATAAHCVVESQTGEVKRGLATFALDFIAGEPQETARITDVWIASFNPEERRGKDWAILAIDRPLGDTRGYLKVMPVDFSGASFPLRVSLSGYQTDFQRGNRPSVVPQCEIQKSDEGDRLLFDCDSYAGISGAPLMQRSGADVEVVAMAVSEFRRGAPSSVHRDEYSDEYANVAIALGDLHSVLNVLRSSVDLGLPAPALAGAFHLEIAGNSDSDPDSGGLADINLVVSGYFSGGRFTDSGGQISCSSPGTRCKGSYPLGTLVTLNAPRYVIVNHYRQYFRYWVCNNQGDTFPGGPNLCRSDRRSCEVRVTSHLNCGAWYQ